MLGDKPVLECLQRKLYHAMKRNADYVAIRGDVVSQYILQKMDSAHDMGSRGAIITRELIDNYLESIREKGLLEDSCKQYAVKLDTFYRFLPEDKTVHQGTVGYWREKLLEEGYAPRTVNLSLSVVNSFLLWLDRRDLQCVQLTKLGEDVQPELSRSEYLRLLQAAKLHNKHRTYLLIKVFATTGIIIGELPEITVEAVRAGNLIIGKGPKRRLLHIPDCVQKELLEYAKKAGIRSGSVFLTRSGKQMVRAHVNACIHELCHDARVDDEKGNPRCLRKLYQETRQDIERNMQLLMDQAYDRLIESEQCTVGWEQK